MKPFPETPPHTWRKLTNMALNFWNLRNTSTHVEKTSRHGRRQSSKEETPPHTWRKLYKTYRLTSKDRNTSTHVEKTDRFIENQKFREKHLHTRGENAAVEKLPELPKETPPHTWRKPGGNLIKETFKRNTSTHVEKTFLRTHARRQTWKHLHTRGENSAVVPRSPLACETPPRTWRKRRAPYRKRRGKRNTSTHVEKTGA